MRQPIPSYAGTAADYAQEDAVLPATVNFDMQPYGMVTLGNLRLMPNANLLQVNNLVGDVIAGTETSRLFGATSTQKATGTRIIYGIKANELDGRVIVRVAM